jgi:hypothetical protein
MSVLRNSNFNGEAETTAACTADGLLDLFPV